MQLKLITLLPTMLSWGFKFIKMRTAAAKIEANPKATNGGIATLIVTVVCLYAESIGIEMTPELQEQVLALVIGVGGIYTAYKGSK